MARGLRISRPPFASSAPVVSRAPHRPSWAQTERATAPTRPIAFGTPLDRHALRSGTPAPGPERPKGVSTEQARSPHNARAAAYARACHPCRCLTSPVSSLPIPHPSNTNQTKISSRQSVQTVTTARFVSRPSWLVSFPPGPHAPDFASTPCLGAVTDLLLPPGEVLPSPNPTQSETGFPPLHPLKLPSQR